MIRIYYHICAMSHAVAVVEEHMSAILYSGLYGSKELEGIYCYITAFDPTSLAYVKNLLALYGSKVHVVETSLDPRRYERFTLEKMVANEKARGASSDGSGGSDDWVLYIHTKGVSQTEPEKITNVMYWTRGLNYGVIGSWRECLECESSENESGIDLIGAYYADTPAPHFPGNFWWAKSSYIRRLSPTIGEGYLEPELNFVFQPLSGPAPKWKAMSVLPSNIHDLYKQPLPMDSYTLGENCDTASSKHD
jgi:hypothetical protein